MADDLKKLNVEVKRDVYEDFTAFIQGKYNKTRGMTGPELEQAMKRHMRISESDKLHSELELIRAEIEGLRSEIQDE